MTDIDMYYALIGGLLIGLAASGLLLGSGRVMGISGILGGLLDPKVKDTLWRTSFLLGLLVGSSLIPLMGFSALEIPFHRGLVSAGVGGVLVGIGTTIGNGCTSGHGVCGMSRLSPRSFVASIVFILSGVVTVALYNTVFGGGL